MDEHKIIKNITIGKDVPNSEFSNELYNFLQKHKDNEIFIIVSELHNKCNFISTGYSQNLTILTTINAINSVERTLQSMKEQLKESILKEIKERKAMDKQ